MNPIRRLLLFRKAFDHKVFGNIWGEYIFNEISTLTLDGSNGIITLRPVRGSANAPFLQTTAPQRPIYTPNSLNGKAGAVYNISNNCILNAGNVASFSSAGSTIFFVISMGNAGMFLSKFGTGTNGSLYLQSSRYATVNTSSTRFNLDGLNLPLNMPVVVAFQTNSTSNNVYLDGMSIATQTFSGSIKSSTFSLQMGNYVNNDATFSGIIYHSLIYNQPLSASAILSITRNYLKPYWGITSELWTDENGLAWVDESGNYWFTP